MPELDRLHAAIVRAVAYSDVFDAPLPRSRVHMALDAPAAAPVVDAALDDGAWADGLLDIGADDVTLAGRGHLRSTAVERRALSRRRWVAARWVGRLLGALPFVRYVGVSGSLAVDSADRTADIDLFLVTATGRLWVARRIVVGIVRLARLVGVRLCPNYLLAESALELDDRTAFVAHELTQLVPIGGSAGHEMLLARNAWAAAFLPNAFTPGPPPGRQDSVFARPGPVRGFVEWLLRAPVFDRLERWELHRACRLYLAERADTDEARFDPDCCKGHLIANGRHALDAFERRLEALGVFP